MTRAENGFTMLELVVCVAVLGILTTIATPAFLRLQLRAWRSEVVVNVRGIALSESAYERELDAFVECQPSPRAPLDVSPDPFDSSVPGWLELAWSPDGPVRCQYHAQVIPNRRGGWVRVAGQCDLDEDRQTATWWMDVDPFHTSPLSESMALRPSPLTAAQDRY